MDHLQKYVIEHAKEHSLSPLASLKLAKYAIVDRSAEYIILHVNILDFANEHTIEDYQCQTLERYLRQIETYVLTPSISFKARTKFENIRQGQSESPMSYMLRIIDIFTLAFPHVSAEEHQTNPMILQKYINGLISVKKRAFILDKIAHKDTYTLSELWKLSSVHDTIQDKLTNSVPTDGYDLFEDSKRNTALNQIEVEESDSESPSTNYDTDTSLDQEEKENVDLLINQMKFYRRNPSSWKGKRFQKFKRQSRNFNLPFSINWKNNRMRGRSNYDNQRTYNDQRRYNRSKGRRYVRKNTGRRDRSSNNQERYNTKRDTNKFHKKRDFKKKEKRRR